MKLEKDLARDTPDVDLPPPSIAPRLSKLGALFLTFCLFASLYISTNWPWFSSISLPKSSHNPFANLSEHCAHTSPVPPSEFHTRQITLARTLHALNASAYIAEPGATASFYGNISSSHWSLSERPLLFIITPRLSASNDIEAHISILTPKFEATRAKMLPIPAPESGLQFAEWPEDKDPYEIAVAAAGLPAKGGTVFVDGSIRNFIVDGLQNALPGSKVVSAPAEIRQLRERKSTAEIELLKCANEVTVLALRAVHSKMYIGMRESEARNMMDSALSAAGLQNGHCLTLFGDNAALPHGSGTDRILGKSDFALFDCGGTLHGYWSDVTRTVAVADSEIPTEHLEIWFHVQLAQEIAVTTARKGVPTRRVDEQARAYLDLVQYGSYFTHRLGHGIGLEMHESPYLRGGSNDTIDTGHTFSDEPGVYIEGKVGVRLEDCFYIDEKGDAVYLTAGVGGVSSTPWFP